MTQYVFFLTISVATFVAGLFYVAISARSSVAKPGAKPKQPLRSILVSTLIAIYLMLLPVIYGDVDKDGFAICKTILISLWETARIALLNADTKLVPDALAGKSGVSSLYETYAFCLFVFAPILTLGYIVSFFKNAAARQRWLLAYRKNAYVFSELNKWSISLAKDLRQQQGKSAAIVFTSIGDSEMPNQSELLAKANEIGAILLRDEITATCFKQHSANATISFLLMRADDSWNTKNALELQTFYKNREKTKIYVFSTSISCEYALNRNRQTAKPIIRRIDEARSLIYRTLYEKGADLFENAIPGKGDADEKTISAVIVGLGENGTEMLKALYWFSQMDGHKLSARAYDGNGNAESKLKATCPGLFTPLPCVAHARCMTQIDISIRSGCDVNCGGFWGELDELAQNEGVSYVFISLGSDELNAETAIRIRSVLSRFGQTPAIHAVVREPEKNKSLRGIETFEGEAYNIEFIGDLDSVFSCETIFNTELEEKALARHMRHNAKQRERDASERGEDEAIVRQKQEAAFWAHEYNYKSSMASVIHMEMREKYNNPCATNGPDCRIVDAREAYRRLEHRRWMAYMHSEGWAYGSKEGSNGKKKDSIAKLHYRLVACDELSEEERAKDDP
jgi:hypothetical protein